MSDRVLVRLGDKVQAGQGTSSVTAHMRECVCVARHESETDLARGPERHTPSSAIAYWFAVYTKGRHEGVVRRGLETLGFEVFLPLVRKLHHWSDRRKLVETPLFPSYVFVRCTEEERARTYGLKGLVRFVTSGSRAVPIPPLEIEAIRQVLSRDVPFDPHPKLRPGHAVRVVAGLFRGITGRLVRRGRHCRLLLAISALGQAISVEVDAADVEPD